MTPEQIVAGLRALADPPSNLTAGYTQAADLIEQQAATIAEMTAAEEKRQVAAMRYPDLQRAEKAEAALAAERARTERVRALAEAAVLDAAADCGYLSGLGSSLAVTREFLHHQAARIREGRPDALGQRAALDGEDTRAENEQAWARSHEGCNCPESNAT